MHWNLDASWKPSKGKTKTGLIDDPFDMVSTRLVGNVAEVYGDSPDEHEGAQTPPFDHPVD